MSTPTSFDPAEVRHAMTYGPGGSFPKAVCGYRGGTKGRMHFCAAFVLIRPTKIDVPPPCPDCLAAIE